MKNVNSKLFDERFIDKMKKFSYCLLLHDLFEYVRDLHIEW